MLRHDVLVIGASAGGIEAVTYLAEQLPRDFPAAVLVVIHVSPESKGYVARILSRAGPLVAQLANHGEPIQPGRIYVTPPGRHFVVHDGTTQLVAGPRVNHNRPAVDPLFRSAARHYGPRVVGLILSGILDDGTAGLMAVKRRGGIAVVQDPLDATYSGMPRSAVQNVDVDHVAPLAEIPALLVRLVGEPVPKSEEPLPNLSDEDQGGAQAVAVDMAEYEAGQEGEGRSVLTCPECGGVLWEQRNGDIVQFRCHVGHLYAPHSLYVDQGEALEGALWSAVRALEERAAPARRLGARLLDRNSPRLSQGFEAQAAEAEQHARILRDLIARQVVPHPVDGEVEPGRA